MAASKKSDERAIKALTPNAVDMTVDGQTLRVPMNKQENAIMNMVLASQMRNLIQEQIKNYKDDEAKMTPKELADMARACRDSAAFSTEVYAEINAIEPPKEKVVEKDDDLDFSKKPIEVKAEKQEDE